MVEDLKVIIILLFSFCCIYWMLLLLMFVICRVLKIDFVDVKCEGVNNVVLGCFGMLLLV